MEQRGLLVGLTGQTGAGKTLVSSLLVNLGYHVIDADMVARQVVERGAKCTLDLAVEFGIGILNADGTPDRKKLGNIVFSDKRKRGKLGRIIFPYIQEAVFSQVETLFEKGAEVVFLDAPTLIESGTHKDCDRVVSVLAPRQIRLERILKRDGITEEDAVLRIKAQHDDDFYVSCSDFVIENDGNLNQLRDKINLMLDTILSKKG